MRKKSQEQLLEEFSQEINQMTGEEIMKGIYEELIQEGTETSEIQLLPANNSGHSKHDSNWIDDVPGNTFLDKYND